MHLEMNLNLKVSRTIERLVELEGRGGDEHFMMHKKSHTNIIYREHTRTHKTHLWAL
jgi:hypothetical protein